jgi:hypothetical protein
VKILRAEPPPWRIGQVSIRPGFELRHLDDDARAPGDLRHLASLEDLRDLANADAAGNFRPLRAAPDLRSGWIYLAPECESLHLALDCLYPAELANALLARDGRLPVTPWRETAERQTGRFRIVRESDDPALAQLVAENCVPHCRKRRLWPPATDTSSISGDLLPLLCPEACNFLVGKAREKLKGSTDEE